MSRFRLCHSRESSGIVPTRRSPTLPLALSLTLWTMDSHRWSFLFFNVCSLFKFDNGGACLGFFRILKGFIEASGESRGITGFFKLFIEIMWDCGFLETLWDSSDLFQSS